MNIALCIVQSIFLGVCYTRLLLDRLLLFVSAACGSDSVKSALCVCLHLLCKSQSEWDSAQ